MAKKRFHKKYNDYMNMVINSPEYKGLLSVDLQFGKFNWLGPLSTPKGKARRAWWDEQCKIHGIDTTQKGCYAQVALAIHPTKKHVCQCCGKELSLEYVYPHKDILKQLNLLLGSKFKQTEYTISEIVMKFCTTQELVDAVSKLFNGVSGLSKESLLKYIELNGISKLSPGAMSNSPDRFDGYHSYGLCCRKKEDISRHDPNMKLYGQDRRAYEQWSDGDWNKANVLMSALRNAPKMICPKCNSKTKKSMSADHVGPISLGFCHNLQFAPMCKSCNSAKNNRLYKSDVDTLLQLEVQNIQVVSWHSKHVWDRLKNTINNDDDAFRLSKVMNACHKNVLYLFYLIYYATGKDFLMRYLHPEYAMFNHRVTKLNLNDLSKSTFSSSPTNSKNKHNLRDRYIRVAFDSLESVGKKKNRKIKIIIDKDDPDVINIITLINEHKYEEADLQVKQMVNNIADSIISSIPN